MPKIKLSAKYILPFMSAGLLLLSFPPRDSGVLAWIALVPLIWFAFAAVSVPMSFLGGFAAGFCFQLGLHSYLLNALTFYLPMLWGWLVLVLAAILMGFPIGLFTALLTWGRLRLRPAVIPLWAGSLWVSLELLRSLGFLAHTGGNLAYTQWRFPGILNLAASYGSWGISLAMVIVQTLLVMMVISGKVKIYRGVMAGVIIFLLLGLVLPETFPVTERPQPLRIVLQQGNIPHYRVVSAAAAEGIFSVYQKLNRQALQGQRKPDLIVLPETVVSVYLQRQNPEAEADLQQTAQAQKVNILYGIMATGAKGRFNSVRLADARGGSDVTYNKMHLVPFVEYFPWRTVLNRLLPMDMEIALYTPGEEMTVFTVGDSKIAANICFESFFGRYARSAALKGAEHLFVLSNDAWFDGTSGPLQHVQASALRAAETGMGVTQVANTGITASFDYRGQPVLFYPAGKRAAVPLDTTLANRFTPYRWWGDALAWFCLCLSVLIPVTGNRYQGKN